MSETEQSATKEDANKLLMDSLSKGVDALDKHQYKDGEDTKKVFGFELDSAFANLLEVGYTTFIGSGTKLLKPKIYGTVQQLGKGNIDAKSLNHVAAGVAFAVNAGVYALPSITETYGMWKSQREAQADKVRQLGPVLDLYKGKHGFAAYNGVRLEDNEMIAHDRWRTSKINHTKLTNMIIPALTKIVPNIWFHERDTIEAARTGLRLNAVQEKRLFDKVAAEHGEDIAKELNIETVGADDVTHEHVAQLKDNPRVKGFIKRTQEGVARKNSSDEGFSLDGIAGKLGSNGLLTTLANQWVKSGNRKLERSFSSKYDALDMVLNLQSQLGSEPTPSSFQLPHHGRSLPLEAYIAEIMMQHQRDMANMNPNYTQIRDALKDNVLAAAKPLAKALKKGDIGALALVEYIGGGKIIRNQGRAIASSDDVEAMIEHDHGKHQSQASVDPKEFWCNAAYSERDAKEAFAELKGEERAIAISWIPRDLRKQFGISEKESAEVDASAAKEMDEHIAEAIVATSKMDKKTLKNLGIADVEIKQLMEAAREVEQGGAKAAHSLKSSAMHPNGIERILLSVAVGGTQKGEQNFADLIKQGRQALAENAHNDNEHADNDNSYAEREERRRTGTHDQEVYRD